MSIQFKCLTVFAVAGSFLILTGCPKLPKDGEKINVANQIAETETAKPSQSVPAEKTLTELLQKSDELVQKQGTNSSLSSASAVKSTEVKPAAPKTPALASAADIEAAQKRIDELKGSVKKADNGALISLTLPECSVTVEDMTLFGRLKDLETIDVEGPAFSDEILAPISGLENLKSLRIFNSSITITTIEMIKTSFTKLETLNIQRNLNLDNSALEVVKDMPNLKTLILLYNSFDNIGMLKVSKCLTLEKVDVRGCDGISDGGMKYLARLPELKELQIRSNLISDAGVEHLAAAPKLSFIEFQDSSDIQDSSAEFFKKMPALTGLRFFRCASLSDAFLVSLADDAQLTRLELRGLSVSNAGIAALQKMTKLEELELSELGTVDNQAILELMPKLQNLKSITLFSMPVNDASVEVIAQLPNVKELTLRALPITDKALEAIISMSKLETLDIREDGDLSLAVLEKIGEIKTLKKLYIKGTKLTGLEGEAALNAIKAKLPKLSVSAL